MKFYNASVVLEGEIKHYSGWGAYSIIEQLVDDKVIPRNYLEPREYASQKLKSLKINKIITLAKL